MFNCFCATDYDPPIVYDSKIVKAGKDHRCYECGAVIKKGDKHERVNALYDSPPWSKMRTCLICVAIRKDFTSKGCGFVHGSLWEDIRNAYEDAGAYDCDDEDPWDWLE